MSSMTQDAIHRREWRKAHPIVNKRSRRAYYDANRDYILVRMRMWYKKHKKKCLQYQKEYRVKNLKVIKYREDKARKSKPAHFLFLACRTRAKLFGLAFNLDESDISIPKTCPVLGILIKRGKGTYHAGSPTVDRINNNLGYVKGNIAVISFRANNLKSDATRVELEKIAEYMKRHEEAINDASVPESTPGE